MTESSSSATLGKSLTVRIHLPKKRREGGDAQDRISADRGKGKGKVSESSYLTGEKKGFGQPI